MSLITKTLRLSLSADSTAFTSGITRASGALDKLSSSFGTASRAAGGFNLGHVQTSLPRASSTPAGSARSSSASPPSATSSAPTMATADVGDLSSTRSAESTPKAAGPDAGAMAAQQTAMMARSLAPLASLGTQIRTQLDQVGGTIVTLARRIDGAMRFPALEKGLQSIQSKIRSGFATASTAATEDLSRLQRATLALGPAADRAISAYLGFRKVQGVFSNLGDVAGRSLSRLTGTRFDAAEASAGRLGGSMRAIAPAANAAATSIKGVGLQIGIAFGAVGVVYKLASAVKSFVVGGIKGASDLNETISKTQEVFGSSTSKVTSLANDMAKSFGLPKGAILDAASSIGLIGKGAGQTSEQASTMATTMAKLAADASSFYNVPLDAALQKIQSGLVGESEPLRSFGVLLSETAVKAEGLRMGLIKGKQDLSEQGKVAARASLIQKGLATSSGDLARTQAGTANQFRSLSGTIGNLATDIGTTLLPAINAGIQVLTGIATAAASAFEGVKPALASFSAGVVEAFGVVGVMYRNFDSITQITFLKAQEMGQNFIQVLAVIPENLSMIGSYMGTNWKAIMFDLYNSTRTMSENIDKNLGALFTSIQGFFKGEGFKFSWTPMLDGFQATAEKLPGLIKPAFVSMDSQIAAVGQKMGDLEATRNNALAGNKATGPPKPEKLDLGGGAKDKADADKYHGTAAAKLGSSDAVSAIARFKNSGGGDEAAKKTADNTTSMAQDMKAIRERFQTAAMQTVGNPVSQAIANL